MPLSASPAACTTSSVTAIATDDGLLVRLSGSLTRRDLPALRRALLRRVAPPLVLVDAGRVDTIDDTALAALLAAAAWSDDCGGQLLFSTLSPAVAEAVAELDPRAALPLLPTPAAPADNVRALRALSSEVRVVA